ncbi:transposase [Thiohalocapsa halophila]|uniref:Transposase n=1 Tax=Thiohalocapsa halophila TaxID=69359 RepID=A0ABS1CKJ9_9GAMM|nr:transposase [Thiohalocapsa halophila]MBK1632451.1 transposase [Thiohalocapsa halophila]
MTRTRYRFLGNDAPYFLTMTVVNWLPLFTRPESVQVLFDSWRFLQQRQQLRIHGYVILENHLHLMARSDTLDADIQRFKSFTARKIIDLLQEAQATTLLRMLKLFKGEYKPQSTYQVWQEGSHPQRIENEDVMRQKLDYMHLNPVKRGYVARPEHWLLSSARDYAGEAGPVEVDTAWYAGAD